MSDYDEVQVSGQRDAGKCSAIELVTVTLSLFCRIFKHSDILIFPLNGLEVTDCKIIKH